MVFEIEVFEDGDVFVTKKHKIPPLPTLRYLKSYAGLKEELILYDLRKVDEDIKSIMGAEYNDPVRCY